MSTVRELGPLRALSTRVTATGVSTQLLPQNRMRLQLYITNDSPSVMYVLFQDADGFAAPCTPANYTVLIQPGITFAAPTPAFAGVVLAVWAAGGAGAAQVSEAVSGGYRLTDAPAT